MASNPYVNKVVYGGQTVMDISGDTVTADKLASGYTAHRKDGTQITGTATIVDSVMTQAEVDALFADWS